MTPRLLGFEDSVYSWSARAGLVAKGVDFSYQEINPFEVDQRAGLLAHHPLGRVPVLMHDDFTVYETSAILSYVERGFDGPSLMPEGARAQARALQVAEIVGSYVYWPCVRQMFSHGFYRPKLGADFDEGVIEDGLMAAEPVLSALEGIASEGLVLNRKGLTVADLMLVPMLRYFRAAKAGADMLEAHESLSDWLVWTMQSRAFAITRPKVLEQSGETS